MIPDIQNANRLELCHKLIAAKRATMNPNLFGRVKQVITSRQGDSAPMPLYPKPVVVEPIKPLALGGLDAVDADVDAVEFDDIVDPSDDPTELTLLPVAVAAGEESVYEVDEPEDTGAEEDAHVEA